MATLQELQKRLDEKTFDPSALNKEQRTAVDLAFESGQLKGYANVGEIEKERSIGAKVIASEKAKRDRPFTEATKGMIPFTEEGVERSDLELLGDVTGGGLVYLKDAPKIVTAFTKNPTAGYGIDKMKAAATDFDRFEKAAQRLPFVRQTKILSKSARALGKFVDGFRLLGTAPTQLLATEAKAQAASAVGAGAGSILYDMANVATDFNVAVNDDLAQVSDNDIKKLPYTQQVLVHSAEAMRNALFFNAIGSSLAPILGTTLKGMKGVLGLGGKEAKEMTEAASRRGIQLSMSTVADAGTLGGRLVAGFEKVFGVFPLANTFAKKQRARVEQQTFEAFLDEVVSKAPLEHVGILNYQFMPTMKKNFEQFMNIIQDNYAVVDTIAESMGNPKFIPTKSIKEVAQTFMKRMEQSLPEPMLGRQTDIPYGQRVPMYDAAKMRDSGFDDPFMDVINKVRGMDDARRLGVIQYKNLEEIFDIAGTKGLEEVKRFDPVLSQRYGIGNVNAIDIKAVAGEAGQFNIKKFREAIGYTDEASKKAAMAKWTEMYGGGKQGAEAANSLKQLVDILDKEYGKYISDSNQYIMRRIMLTGGAGLAGGFIAGGGAAGGVAAALPFALMLAGGGFVLSNPKSLKYLLDVYTDLERLDKLGKRADITNMPKSMFRLLNWAAEEDKDFPNVDPKKINFEEVTDYLIKKNILIPELGFSPQAVDPKLRSRFYPELNVVDKAPEAEVAGGLNFLQGSVKGTQKADAVVSFQPQNQTNQPAVYNLTRPAYEGLVNPQYLPQQPAQQTVTPQNYNMLFPNDPLGQAIAERGNQ